LFLDEHRVYIQPGGERSISGLPDDSITAATVEYGERADPTGDHVDADLQFFDDGKGWRRGVQQMLNTPVDLLNSVTC